MTVDPEQFDDVVKRLQRAQGQLGGVIKMIQDGRECEDVVIQISAVAKAVDRAGFAIMARTLRECLTSQDPDAMPVEKMEKLFLSLA